MYFLKKLVLIVLLVISNGISAQKMEANPDRSNVLLYKIISDQKEVIITSSPLISNQQRAILQIIDTQKKVPLETEFPLKQNFVLVDILLYTESICYIIGYEKLSNTQYDIGLMKISSEEGLLWHKDFSKKGIEIPRSIVKLNDNNIAIAGFCATETEEFYKVLKNDLHVLKVSPDGNRIWTKTIGLKNIDEAFLDLSVTDDNELFLLGKRKYFNDKLYVIKINKFGNITWQTTHDIGHLIKSARLTNDTSNTGITIHATVLDIGYKTKELFEKEILFALNNNGERRNLEELATKQLEYNFFADIDYQKNQQMVGIIRTNSLNIRRDPSLTSGVVTNLKKGRTVEIIDKSKTKVRINQMNDYWYLLRVDNGETGWAYGHFIDIVE